MKKYRCKAALCTSIAVMAILFIHATCREGIGAEGTMATKHIIPTAQISPRSVTFNNTRVGDTSPSQVLTVTKTRSILPLYIASVHLADTSNFHVVSDNCSGTVLFGRQSCEIVVDFEPSAKGYYKSDLSVLNTGWDIVDYASLAGEGTAPAVMLSQNILHFGEQTIDRSSAPQTVTLTNTGTAILNISSISASGDYSVTDDCVGPISPDAACSIDVTFTPTSVGVLSGMLTISDDASDSPQTISLRGDGISPSPPSPDASLSTTSLDFGNQVVNTTSDPETVILSNVGTGALNITSISTSGDFSVSDDCGASLAPDQHCTITARFSPLSTGRLYGTLQVTDDASDSPQTVEFEGRGIEPDTAFVTLSTSGLNFGEQVVRTPSGTQSLVLTNTGTSDLVFENVKIEGNDTQSFSLADNCYGSIIPINGTCTLDVTFKPAVEGPLNATLKIASNASDSPQYVALTGTGVGHRSYGIYFTTDTSSVSAGESLHVDWTINGIYETVSVYFGAVSPDNTIYTLNHNMVWQKGTVPIVRSLNPEGSMSGTLEITIPTCPSPGDYNLCAALKDACGLKYPGVVYKPLTVR